MYFNKQKAQLKKRFKDNKHFSEEEIRTLKDELLEKERKAEIKLQEVLNNFDSYDIQKSDYYKDKYKARLTCQFKIKNKDIRHIYLRINNI